MSKIVVLDPGHDIDTAGKESPDKTYQEYEFNWDMVLKIEVHLKRSGITVVKTKNSVTEDKTLRERVAKANQAGADIYYSCHSNALDQNWSSPRGCGFYVYDLGKSAEKLAKEISNKMFPAQTSEFGLRNRGIYVEDFYVLRKTTMPAVLVENAFHTNKDDVALLKSQKFRRKMAEYTAKGICKYLGVKYVEDSNNYDKYGIVKKVSVVNYDSLNVRLGPSVNNTIIGVLNPKCQIEVLGEVNGWYKLFYGAGFGYVNKKYTV